MKSGIICFRVAPGGTRSICWICGEGRCRRYRQRSRLDLPAPLGPTNATTWPGAAARETPWTMSGAAEDGDHPTLSARMTGCAAIPDGDGAGSSAGTPVAVGTDWRNTPPPPAHPGWPTSGSRAAGLLAHAVGRCRPSVRRLPRTPLMAVPVASGGARHDTYSCGGSRGFVPRSLFALPWEGPHVVTITASPPPRAVYLPAAGGPCVRRGRMVNSDTHQATCCGGD